MEKQDAISIMRHLAFKLEDVISLDDMVSPFAEFLAHIQPSVSDKDFAFLSTVGAMIYLKGARQYDSGVEAEELMRKLLETSRNA